MSLKSTADTLARAAANEAAVKAETAAAARRSEVLAAFRDLSGWDATYIDRQSIVTAVVPPRWDRGQSVTNHDIDRLRVDDIVVRYDQSQTMYGRYSLELSCSGTCGGTAGVNLGLLLTSTVQAMADEEKAEHFTQLVAQALQAGAICPWCRANQQRHCPSCGRSN